MGQKLLCALPRGQTHSESWRLAHSVVHRASVKLGAWFDRQPRTYAVSIPSFVGPRAGQRTPCQKTLGEVKQNRCSAPASQDRSSSKSPNDALIALMTDDVHSPAVNWYNFHNRDGLVRRRMRFARM